MSFGRRKGLQHNPSLAGHVSRKMLERYSHMSMQAKLKADSLLDLAPEGSPQTIQ